MTIYLPDSMLARLRSQAARAGKSLSAHIAGLLRPEPRKRQPWPDGFSELYGSWVGRFPEPEDPPPADVEQLE